MDANSITGFGVATLTPFTASGEVDMVALERHTKFLIKGGAQFLVSCGTTGEIPTLSWAEQEKIISLVLKIADGQVPVVVGCTSNNTRSLIISAKQIADLGVRWIMSATPYYNKPTQEGIYQHFKALREETGLAVMAYNIPTRTAGEILPDTIQRLAEDDLIFALKDASANLTRIQKTCSLCSNLRVFSGDDALSAAIVAVGGQGVVSVVGNLVPQLLRAWIDALMREDFSAARKKLQPLLSLFEACFLESSPIPVKFGAEILGLMHSRVRLPLTIASLSTQAKMQQTLQPLKENL